MSSTSVLSRCKAALEGHPSLISRSFVRVGNDKQEALSGKHSVRIMQWNILSDALSQGKDNFIKCPEDALIWKYRKYRSLEEILTYEPDVVCMQEVDHFHDFYQPHLAEAGYVGMFLEKPDSPALNCPNNNGPDGCALFYKTDKFQMDAQPLLLNLTCDGASTTNQVAILAPLTCTTPAVTGRSLVVGVTHLKAKKGWAELRFLQGRDLHQQMLAAYRDQPLLLCGDFNGEPTEPVYSLFENSELNLGSAYKLLSKGGEGEPEYTTWKVRPSGETKHTIDYVWYTKEKLSVVGLLDLPSQESVGPDRLPSYSYPSDHLSLACDFQYIEC